MEKQTFHITIHASREKVWKVLWGEDTYPKWTAVFSEGSRAETDWKKGSKVLFLDEKGSGMVSYIDENIPNEYMLFRHMGTVKNGVEDLESPETREWAGSKEEYTLKGSGGKTELSVSMDVTDEFSDYFSKTFPKALEKVKELSEGNLAR